MGRNRYVNYLLLAAILLLAVVASPADKAPARVKFNPIIHQIVDFAIPYDKPIKNAYSSPQEIVVPHSLGASVPSLSPGNIIGLTSQDLQAVNYQGRMVRSGRNFDSGLLDSLTLLHFSWMNTPPLGDPLNDRAAFYSIYDAVTASYSGALNVTTGPEYAGFVTLETTKDNRAIVCAQMTPTGEAIYNSPTIWYDDLPGSFGFTMESYIPLSLAFTVSPYTPPNSNTVWPHVAFQEKPNGNHVTHVTALSYAGGISRHCLHYYRKEGSSTNLALGGVTECISLSEPDWNCALVVDTPQAPVGGLEASKQSGKVAIFWTANLPDNNFTPLCDTCSVNDDLGMIRNRFENDVYYQISDDYGENWNPRQNITHNNAETADWMPWNDFDGLWDTGDKFHMAWVAADWKRFRTHKELGFGARIFHWTEDYGTMGSVNGDNARTVMVRNEDPILCNAGPFNLNLSKINLAECNSILYLTAVDLWDGHDDPQNPDCSHRGYVGDPIGSVNGEVVLAISDNLGFTWDFPHNLTNSPTPNCDSANGIFGACDSDHWPSITPHGIATLPIDDWSGTVKINPRPSASYPDVIGAEWLDIQYVNDRDPGSPLTDGSIWTESYIRHFRLACVGPDMVPILIYQIEGIVDTAFVTPTQIKSIPVILENIGNAPSAYTIAWQEDTGPPDWLSVAGTVTSLSDGANNKDTFYIVIDAALLTSGSIVYGRVLIDHNGPSDVDTIPVTVVTSNAIVYPQWDTVSTGVVSLAVASNGQYGGAGYAGTKRVRMDYWNSDCDTSEDIPGDTRLYLFDGSFAAVHINGPNTLTSNQIFESGKDTRRLIHVVGTPAGPFGGIVYEYWNSGKLVNSDSSLAFAIKWVAPYLTASWGTAAPSQWFSDQQFIVRELKVWHNLGVGNDSIVIADIIDWDVPADRDADNAGEVDASNNLLYQVGAEYNTDPEECQENDHRYAGASFAFFRAYWNHDNNPMTPKRWTIRNTTGIGYGGYFGSNFRDVYSGWTDSLLYDTMKARSGYSPWTHANVDSQKTDIYSVLTSAMDYVLEPGDTAIIYIVYSTLMDASNSDRIKDLASKGRNFSSYFGCCNGLRGDPNGDGTEANILDLSFAVDRVFRGSLPPSCAGEGDINSDRQILNVLDLNFLVNKIFRGGPNPLPCTSPPL